LVHIHNLHGYWINQKKILIGLAELDIPIVWTLHDYWPITGHCAYFEESGCEKWRVTCEDCPQIGRYPKSYLDNSTKNFLEKQSIYDELENLHIVTVSEHSRNLVKDSILERFPVTTIYNSVDTSIFRPVAPAMKFSGKIVVGSVAKVWDDRKGLADILKVRSRLSDSYVFLVVGLTKNQIRRVPPGVVGIPSVSVPGDLAALYSSMDVFFNPSAEETFGLTSIEAMACGIPAVLYGVSASMEIQPDFMHRGIAERHHYDDTAEKIAEIATSVTPELKESLVRYVSQKFSRDAFLSAYYGLYTKIQSVQSGSFS
jgi:glycosyltransferase involved in cell wall biosynthesis